MAALAAAGCGSEGSSSSTTTRPADGPASAEQDSATLPVWVNFVMYGSNTPQCDINIAIPNTGTSEDGATWNPEPGTDTGTAETDLQGVRTLYYPGAGQSTGISATGANHTGNEVALFEYNVADDESWYLLFQNPNEGDPGWEVGASSQFDTAGADGIVGQFGDLADEIKLNGMSENMTELWGESPPTCENEIENGTTWVTRCDDTTTKNFVVTFGLDGDEDAATAGICELYGGQ